MANINFPSNPTASQTYTFGFTTWTYNGNAWVAGGGSIGAQGFTGPQGFQGLQGPQGNQGVQGSQGLQGYTGPQGFQGETGPQGFQGDMGPQGPTGIQGYTGPQGSEGQSSNRFLFSATSSTSGNPSASFLLWNSATQVEATQINISHIDAIGVDIDVLLSLIKIQDTLIIQDRNNSDNYQNFTVTNPITIIPNSYVEVPVIIATSSGTGTTNFSSGQNLALFLLSAGVDGPQGIAGPQGFTGPQGPEGPQGFTYPVSASASSALWYNSIDNIDPQFDSADNLIYSNGNLYIQRGCLYIAESVAATNVQTIQITTEPITGVGRTWTIPNTSDTFVGLASTQTLTNKTFNSIKINPSGVTSSKGDIFYTPTTGANLASLSIGGTGSVLYVDNGAPTWSSVGSSYSVLTINESGIPTWKKRNFIKVTDGTAVTGSGAVNIYTDGVLIPANSVSAGDIIELRSRIRKTGTVGTVVNRLYIGVNNSLTSANLVGLSTAMGNTTLTGQMVRTLVVKSATQSEVYPVTQAALNDDSLNTGVAVTTYNIDWTIDQYFVSSVQNSVAADSTRSSFLQVKIFE